MHTLILIVTSHEDTDHSILGKTFRSSNSRLYKKPEKNTDTSIDNGASIETSRKHLDGLRCSSEVAIVVASAIAESTALGITRKTRNEHQIYALG